MMVKCPSCKRIWIAHSGDSGITCNCHLYCEDGNKPSDCTLIDATTDPTVWLAEIWDPSVWSFYPAPFVTRGNLNWPRGLHVDANDNSDDFLHLRYFCTTHKKYSFKQAIIIEPDWNKLNQRAPKELRMSHGLY